MKVKISSLSAKDMFELECWLYNNYSRFNSSSFFDGFSKAEADYLRYAYHMPYSVVNEFLNAYDHSSPKMDELKFVESLRRKLDIECENIIVERIRQVRRVQKYCLQNTSGTNISDIFKNNVGMLLYRTKILRSFIKKGMEKQEEFKRTKTWK